MIGTIVNALAIAVGAELGLLVQKRLKPELGAACMKAVGAAVLLIGLSGALSGMLTAGPDGTLTAGGGLVLLASLAAGTAAGEALRLQDRVESLSGVLERRLNLSSFSRGFVDASVLFCAGSMAIVGALNDGLTGDASMLFVKAAIDGVSAIFLAAALGSGVLFSGLVVLLYQGAVALSAGLLAPLLGAAAMGALSMVGFAIVSCIGLNLTGATQIKTTNMIFALPLAPLLAKLPFLN